MNKIVLLGHSHVGVGAYEAIMRSVRGELVLAVGYTQTETLVPAPNLVEIWKKQGLDYISVPPGERIDNWLLPTGDILISANWRHKVPKEYYEKFRLAVNFHGSNTHLPQYRGRRPVQKQIEDGKETYFLTLHRLNEKYDDGEILAQAMQQYHQVPTQSMVYADFRILARGLTTWLLDNVEALCQTSPSA